MANEKRLIDANALIEALPIVTEDRKITLYGAVADFMIMISAMPTVDAVEVEKYKSLLDMYHDLRENFIDYVCSGTCNVAPYCLNRCEGCVDSRGWCNQGSDECHGFNPAEIII